HRSGDPSPRNPITGIAVCCARAARGHAAVAPPSSVMNSRRLMTNIGLPPTRHTPPGVTTSGRGPLRSIRRTLSLPQNGRQVLETDLNCSESRPALPAVIPDLWSIASDYDIDDPCQRIRQRAVIAASPPVQSDGA